MSCSSVRTKAFCVVRAAPSLAQVQRRREAVPPFAFFEGWGSRTSIIQFIGRVSHFSHVRCAENWVLHCQKIKVTGHNVSVVGMNEKTKHYVVRHANVLLQHDLEPIRSARRKIYGIG